VVRVAPYLLAPEHPLYHVNGVFNAVFVHGNMLGDGMFYGSGAGKLPTASAVVGDMVDMAKHIDKNIRIEWKPEKLTLADAGEQENRFFVRTDASQSAIEEAFGKVTYVEAGQPDEIGFMTGLMKENDYASCARKLGQVRQMIRLA
jgi:homoserine dehydrogenase